MPDELPAMQSAGQCTPECIKADEEMLASIVQVMGWRREGDVILLVGPATMKFRPATNQAAGAAGPKNSRPHPELPIAHLSEPGLGYWSSPRLSGAVLA
ncbi:MAG TPA: hypothetical protein VFN63_12195 [Pseudolabrys sp.]|nr:hypothetical protein [Pseudolabrys sp.]